MINVVKMSVEPLCLRWDHRPRTALLVCPPGVSFLYGLGCVGGDRVLFTMISAYLLPAMSGWVGPKVMSRKQKRAAGGERPRASSGLACTGSGPAGPPIPASSRPSTARSRCSSSSSSSFRPLVAGSAPRPGQRPARNDDANGLTTCRRRASGRARMTLELVSVVSTPERDAGGSTRWRPRVAKQPNVESAAPNRSASSKTGQRLGDGALQRLSEDCAARRGDHRPRPHLRDDTDPEAVGDSGVKILVGGNTAIFVDFVDVCCPKFLLFIALVVILSFIRRRSCSEVS